MTHTLQFIAELAANNNREWFAANKERYLAIRAKLESFTAQWVAQLRQMDPEIEPLQPKDCLYRIYRDTRFSKDKTPYKHWMGIYVAKHGGRRSPYGGYYLHLQPGQCLFAGGIWCPEPELLKRLRQDVYDNVDEIEQIFARPEVNTYFSTFESEDNYKKVPTSFLSANPSYPHDWPHADWLKYKSYNFSCPLSDDLVAQPDFLDQLMLRCRAAKPINDFLNYTLDNPD